MKWLIEIEIEAPSEEVAGKHLKMVAAAFDIAATHKLPLDALVLENKDLKITLNKKN